MTPQPFLESHRRHRRRCPRLSLRRRGARRSRTSVVTLTGPPGAGSPRRRGHLQQMMGVDLAPPERLEFLGRDPTGQATLVNLVAAQVVLDCERDEEARPRAGYRPGAPGGCQVEHVDEHLRAAARMGASPFPSVRPRVANLHGGCGPHSRDRGCRDRAHCTTSQPQLKQVSRYIHEHWRSPRFRPRFCAHDRAAQAVACGQLMRLIQHVRDTDCR